MRPGVVRAQGYRLRLPPSAFTLKEEPEAMSLGERRGSQLTGAGGPHLNGSSQFFGGAKPQCNVECLHLSKDTQGPYHLSFSVHRQIQNVVLWRDEQKAAFIFPGGSRAAMAS